MNHTIDFTTSIELIEGAHLETQPDEQWEIYERYLELEKDPPFGASLRLVDHLAVELVGWAPLVSISLVYGQGALLRRLERLEAAIGNDLNLWPFGALRTTLVIPPETEFWPELKNCVLPRLHPNLGYDQGLDSATDRGLLVRGILHLSGKRIRIAPNVPRP